MEQAHVQADRDLTLGTIEVPWNLVVPTVDVHLVGYGNRFPNDFTLEMLAVLQRCKRIFAVPPIHAPEFNIPQMESLMGLYAADKRRIDTYLEMAERVLAAAAEDPPVALATYGSVLCGAVAPHVILEQAHDRGLTVHVTNAASCFDGIWADLNMDPFYGFEVWEATVFVDREIQPNTSANLMLPQAPVLDVLVGPETSSLAMTMSSSLARLRDHLLKFYAAEHEVHFVATSSGAGPHILGSQIESLPLTDLEQPARHQASTLVVPRAKVLRGKVDYDRPALAQSAAGDAR